MATLQVRFSHPWDDPDSGISYATGQLAVFDEDLAKRLIFNGLALANVNTSTAPLIPPGLIDDAELGTVLQYFERKIARAGANPGWQVVLAPDGQTLILQPNVPDGGSGGGGTVVSDATGSVKGIIRLAGDLGGTALEPRVPGLASKLDLEQVQDAVNDMLVAGTNIGKVYDDSTGKITLSSLAVGGGGGTTDPEVVRDVVAAALVAGAGVSITANDTGDTITIAATAPAGGDPEFIRDTMALALSAGDGIEIVPNDSTNLITIRATGGTSGGGTLDLVDGGTPTSTFLDPPAQAEFIRDTIAAALRSGGGMVITTDDNADTITLTSTGSTDPEIVRDTMAAALVAGPGVTVTPNDAGDSITISATGDAETICDTIAAALVAGPGMSIAHDDALNQIIVSATGGGTLDAEGVRDTIGAALVASGSVTITVSDAGDTITIGSTATANAPDTFLRDRNNHTGTQAASTIADLQSVVKGLVNAAGSATNPHTSATAARNPDFTVNFWACWPSTPVNAAAQDQLLVPADSSTGPSTNYLQQFGTLGSWTADGSTTTLAVSTDRFTSAPSSLRLTPGAGPVARASSPKIPVAAGQSIAVTLRAGSTTADRQVLLSYRLFDAGGTLQGSGQAAQVGSTMIVPSSQTFTSMAYTLVVPNTSTITQMELIVTVLGAQLGELFYVDDVTAG